MNEKAEAAAPKRRRVEDEENYDVTQTTKSAFPLLLKRTDGQKTLNQSTLYKHIKKKELDVWPRGQCQQLALAKASGDDSANGHNNIKDIVHHALQSFGDLKVAFNLQDDEHERLSSRISGYVEHRDADARVDMEAWGSSYFLTAAAYGLKRDIVQVESKALGRCQLGIYRKDVKRNLRNNVVSYQFLACKEKEIFHYVDANSIFIAYNGSNHYKALICLRQTKMMHKCSNYLRLKLRRERLIQLRVIRKISQKRQRRTLQDGGRFVCWRLLFSMCARYRFKMH